MAALTRVTRSVPPAQGAGPLTSIASYGSRDELARSRHLAHAAHGPPAPLADRLRPRTLEDVVGQDHLLGPQGTLTRMLTRG